MKLHLPFKGDPVLEIQGSYCGAANIYINDEQVISLLGEKNGTCLYTWNPPEYINSPIVNIRMECTAGYATLQGVTASFGIDVNTSLPYATKKQLYQTFDKYFDGYFTFQTSTKGWKYGENICQNEMVSGTPVVLEQYISFDEGQEFTCQVNLLNYNEILKYIIDYQPGKEFFENFIPYK